MPNNGSPASGGTGPTNPETKGSALPAKIEQVLVEAVPRQKLSAVRQAIVSYVHQVDAYAGPLPHPEHLEHFERTLPGAADRILIMAEQEQGHRHAWEMRELGAATLTERIGLFGGIAVAIGLIV